MDRLLRPTHGLLKLVAAHFPFEAAVGANGAVWVRANEAKNVVAVGKVLQAADQLPTQHASGTPTASEDDDGMDEDAAKEEEVDADYVLKHRAARLDAKAVRKLVQDFL